MFQIPATIEGVTTRSDKTLKITIGTQELSPTENAQLFGLAHSFGFMMFKENPIEEKDVIDIPDFTPEFKGEKSPSQRMRGALYVLWEQSGQKEEWEVFYRNKMEKLITYIKEKLS